jgi:undecaprenyl-diphosphatase
VNAATRTRQADDGYAPEPARNLGRVTSLHLDPPMTLRRLVAGRPWILLAAAIVFAALGVGAVAGVLAWDGPITRWVVEARTAQLDSVFLRLSFLGSTPVVLAVSAIAALLAARRCPRLALAILVIAAARPATEFLLKELVSRARPDGNRLVGGVGYSFPSGHPFAVVASWGMLPLVAALYTKRRLLWWISAVTVWTLAVLVAASRVWLGVHWASDVVAALVLGVLGVALAERYVVRPDCTCWSGWARTKSSDTETSSCAFEADHVGAHAVDRPVLETPA